jgi:hypothetical protein
MKKVIFINSALIIASLSVAPAMATDFHALSGLPSAPMPLSKSELFEVEGGATCNQSAASSGGGVALCGSPQILHLCYK